MIRPTMEVMERLVNPESHIRTLDQYRSILLCSLIENLGNKTCVNRIMHYFMDLEAMEAAGITTQEKAREETL
jgi:hypothetical protein